MPRKRRGPLVLNNEEREQLKSISRSQTEPARRVERATIMLYYSDGETISDIARWLDGHRSTVNRCIARALKEGPLRTLDDRPRSGRPRLITPEARAWLVSLACQKPKKLGYSYELWTLKLLTQHARKTCEQEGHPSLKKVSRGTVWKILNDDQIKPHKVRYYLEKRDEQFELKMAQVLEVYRQAEQVRNAGTDDPESKAALSSRPPTVYLSYDTKPGIQAIDNTASDLPPVAGKHATLRRDHEYRRHGVVSLLAGIDLVTGEVLGLVRDRHRSREFIEFLEVADSQYPQDSKIHLILDNHSAHTSKETRAFLASKPGRFEFTFTPKHGSWLNLIETFFSKMARTVLRAIRVDAKVKLKRRIELYLQEVNADPVIFRWSYGLG
jgi:transposase